MDTKNLLDIQCTFWPNIYTAEPAGTRSLFGLLTTTAYKEQVEAVRLEPDEDKQKAMKKELPCYTPSGLFKTSAKEDDLQQHTGYICIDVDQKDNPDCTNFSQLKEFCPQNPNILYCGFSVRGRGYFIIIPLADPQRHREAFKSLQKQFAACGLVIDPRCVNIGRKRVVSYDPDPYINTAALPYTPIPEPQRPAPSNPDHSTARPAPSGASSPIDTLSELDTKQQIERLVTDVESKQLDITGAYPQWFEILCALANTFGAEGRDYAHRLSRFGDTYTAAATDKQYTECLRHPDYRYTMGTVYHYAALYR